MRHLYKHFLLYSGSTCLLIIIIETDHSIDYILFVSCYYDWLRISEPADTRTSASVPALVGPSSGSGTAQSDSEVILGVYCGTRDARPASVAAAYPSLLLYSASNALTLRFHTDGSVVGRGFRARLALVSPPGCGGRLERLSRPGAGVLITSPGYAPGTGARYASALDCRWLVDMAPGLMTRFELLAADLEYMQPPESARSSADALFAWCSSNDLDRLEVPCPVLCSCAFLSEAVKTTTLSGNRVFMRADSRGAPQRRPDERHTACGGVRHTHVRAVALRAVGARFYARVARARALPQQQPAEPRRRLSPQCHGHHFGYEHSTVGTRIF